MQAGVSDASNEQNKAKFMTCGYSSKKTKQQQQQKKNSNIVASILYSFILGHFLGKVCCLIMRTFKQLYAEAHVVRNRGLLSTVIWVRPSWEQILWFQSNLQMIPISVGTLTQNSWTRPLLNS